MDNQLNQSDYNSSSMNPQDERMWSIFAHLGALLGIVIPFANILAPLVIWLVYKDQSKFVDENAKESLNFQITITILGAVLGFLGFVGFFAFFGIGAFAFSNGNNGLGVLTIVGGIIAFVIGAIFTLALIVLPIVAALKASNGGVYRYPFSIRLIK